MIEFAIGLLLGMMIATTTFMGMIFWPEIRRGYRRHRELTLDIICFCAIMIQNEWKRIKNWHNGR